MTYFLEGQRRQGDDEAFRDSSGEHLFLKVLAPCQTSVFKLGRVEKIETEWEVLPLIELFLTKQFFSSQFSQISKCLENTVFFLLLGYQTFFGTPCTQVKWSLLLGRRRTDVSACRLQDGLSQGALELMCKNTFG